MTRYHTNKNGSVPFTAQEEIEWDANEAAELAAAPARAIARLRSQRDALIAATDWRVLPDQPVSQAWMDYRQALRDLPANTVDPANPVWPVEPV